MCALGLDSTLDCAQLRGLLFAEHSTVVAEPDEHEGSLLGEGTQRDCMIFQIKRHG
jgi:hypothetical protein